MTATATAHDLGAAACAQGIPCAPALDAAMLDLLTRPLEHTERMSALHAWVAGWHAANLAA